MSSVVLYIEDDADNILLVERLLSRRPAVTLHVATSGSDGVKAAVAEQPDLILLDNHLPDATGTDVLRRLASSDATAALPVVILTGDSGRDLAAHFIALGASAFVEKPYDLLDLLSLVDRYVD